VPPDLFHLLDVCYCQCQVIELVLLRHGDDLCY
jgi:hypothetical protein